MSDAYTATARIINQLYGDGTPDKGALAELRRTTAITDKGAEKIWPLIFSVVPKLSTNGKPTKLETAVYTALHCYAAFQQGNDSFVFGQISRSKDKEESRENGVSLFTALRKMKINDSNEKKALDRRVTALLATTNISSATNSINHLVSILKGKKMGEKIDFAQLAEDLYNFQWSTKNARFVALKWGKDYYWNVYKLASDND